MVATLIKYEFLRTRRWLAVAFAAATAMTLAGSGLALTRWPLIANLGAALAFVGVGAFLVVVIVGLAFDYWHSSYSKTGYFTQSLPIKGSTIYFSKLAWGAIVALLALVWNLLLAFIAYVSVARSLGIEHPVTLLRDKAADLLEGVPGYLVALAVVVVLLVLFAYVAQFYFAASIGSEARLNRLGVGGPVLVWFGLYLVMQVLLFIGVVAIPLGIGVSGARIGLVGTNFAELIATNADPEAMPVGWLPIMFALTAVLVWRTVVSWNRKVSLA